MAPVRTVVATSAHARSALCICSKIPRLDRMGLQARRVAPEPGFQAVTLLVTVLPQLSPLTGYSAQPHHLLFLLYRTTRHGRQFNEAKMFQGMNEPRIHATARSAIGGERMTPATARQAMRQLAYDPWAAGSGRQQRTAHLFLERLPADLTETSGPMQRHRRIFVIMLLPIARANDRFPAAVDGAGQCRWTICWQMLCGNWMDDAGQFDRRFDITPPSLVTAPSRGPHGLGTPHCCAWRDLFPAQSCKFRPICRPVFPMPLTACTARIMRTFWVR